MVLQYFARLEIARKFGVDLLGGRDIVKAGLICRLGEIEHLRVNPKCSNNTPDRVAVNIPLKYLLFMSLVIITLGVERTN